MTSSGYQFFPNADVVYIECMDSYLVGSSLVPSGSLLATEPMLLECDWCCGRCPPAGKYSAAFPQGQFDSSSELMADNVFAERLVYALMGVFENECS